MTPPPSTIDPAAIAGPDRPPHPQGVPLKFSADGVVQRYRGNTTLCHIPADAPILAGLRATYDAFAAHPTLARKICLLPPSSWHMTVLDGVREAECEPGMWPEGREKEPLDACTQAFAASLQQQLTAAALAAEGLQPPYRMRVCGFHSNGTGFGLRLEGATAAEEARMRRLRDRIADAFGFRAPNHTTYRFHATIAYLRQFLDPGEGGDVAEWNKLFAELEPKIQMEVELGPVEFCTFEDMYAFSRLFYLGEEGSQP
ncbi:RNA ligase/cyclic nucleotide phosphodiesterase [Niveomyces insectorum RCEF 264]|uniref:RNA ligase/cyclic nucleotide phosphodiesterase n=1 Tax=Niveomyces insectorum RCEF 264 TaxID=1081102 RepID=A0A167U6P1_9HYPO|nr:RNA ligase/cyclic nucleotide phosphodiesterase [Niveomyces insectorum RCEF 264]